MAKSPTPDKLNSLTLRGTKYSDCLLINVADRRDGLSRLNGCSGFINLRGKELYE